MKKTSYILFFILLFCNQIWGQFNSEDYKNRPNSRILNDLRDKINEIEQFEELTDFFVDEKIYSKDKVIPAFKIDSTKALNIFHDLWNTELNLFQDYSKEKGWEIKLQKGHFFDNLTDDDYSIEFIPKRIYFFDGSTQNNPNEINTSFHFSEKSPYNKKIDSIDFDLKLKYVSQYDKIELNSANKQSSYDKKFINLIKTDKNNVDLIFHKDLDPFFVEGLNAKKQVLEEKGYSKYKKNKYSFLTSIKNSLTKIVSEAEKDTLLPRNKFQEKYISKLYAELEENSKNDTIEYKAKYEGLVDGVRLYFAKESKEKILSKTIRADQFEDFILSSDKNSSFIYDNYGNLITKTDDALYEINPFYYEGTKSFLHFSLSSKKIISLSYYDVKRVTNRFVQAQEDEGEKFILLDQKNQQIGIFDYIEGYNNTVIARSGNDTTLILPNNETLKLKNAHLSEMIKGISTVFIDKKIGFINEFGKYIIPVEYEDAKEFEDMDGYTSEDLKLFAVYKNNKWGFVNEKQQVIIPFEYDDVLPFSYGVTMVKKGNSRGLINNKNKVIVPLTEGTSYALSKNFGKRSYSISAGYFDHLGNKIKD